MQVRLLCADDDLPVEKYPEDDLNGERPFEGCKWVHSTRADLFVALLCQLSRWLILISSGNARR